MSDGAPDTFSPASLPSADLLLDQRRRWQGGERVLVEGYLAQQPHLASATELLLDLICNEFLLRQQHGEAPQLEEYLARFPHLADPLRLQFEMERALQVGGLLPSAVDRPTVLEQMGDMATMPADLPALPGYELLGELGRGGMGVVYQARQVALNRLVALKMILAGGHAGEQELARFRTEAEAVARLQHPHIVQVFEVGEQGGLPYCSLEFCPGGSLAQKLDGTPLPPRQAAQLVQTLAHAMQAAHQAGIVHRDLKPANVLLTAEGTPKVTDFGLAKKLDDAAGLTASGAIMGTPSYMAPEQAGGHGKRIGPATDVYALGAILYELLTGRPPFKAATSLDTVLQVISDEPVPPRRLQPTVPRDLETICLKCLHKEPSKRYTSALELAEDLRRFQAGEPIRARPVRAGERVRKWAKRRPAVAALAAALLGALGALLGLGIWSYLQISQALGEANRAREQEALERSQAEQHRDTAVAEAYRALLSETRALRLARTPGWRATALENLRRLGRMETPARDLPELRSEAVACAGELDAREVTRFGADGYLVWSLDFSPDGQSLASADFAGRVRLWDLARRHLLREVADPDAARFVPFQPESAVPGVRFHPDGGYLAHVTWKRKMDFLNLKEQPAPRAWPERTAQALDLAFDRKGGLLAVGWGDGQVSIHDTSTGEAKRVVQARLAAPNFGQYMPVALTPLATRLAARGPDNAVAIYLVAEEKPPLLLHGHRGQVRSLSFSPDGWLLASASDDRTAKLWDIRGGKELLTLHGHTGNVTGVAFSPAGDLVATSSDDRSVRLWDPRTGQTLLVLHPGIGPLGCVAFSPDGTHLATALNTVCLYQLTGRQERQRLTTAADFTGNVTFHPRRAVLATTGREPWVRLWDVPTGRQLRNYGLGHQAMLVNGLSFSPDGELLAASPVDPLKPRENYPVCLVEVETRNVRRRFSSPGQGPYPSVAFDPSGQRLAALGAGGTAFVWDAATGEVVQGWPLTGGRIPTAALLFNRMVAFIKNGEQLVLGEPGGRIRIGDLASGQTVRQTTVAGGLLRCVVAPGERCLAAAGCDGKIRLLSLPDLDVMATLDSQAEASARGGAFSPDGRLLASGGSGRQVFLWDMHTFQKLLSFPPLEAVVSDLAFHPDGTLLAIAGGDKLITVWDLSRVRPLLADLGFDWNAPPPGFPVGAAASPTPPVKRMRWPQHIPPEWVIELLGHVLEAKPDQAEFCTALAWLYATGPEKLRDAQKALPLAERAVRLAPDEPLCLNTMGVVSYRLGRHEEALTTLTRSDQLHTARQKGPLPADLAFLAMAQHRLGQKEQAQATLARLLETMKESRWAGEEEARNFLQEAEALIEGRPAPPKR